MILDIRMELTVKLTGSFVAWWRKHLWWNVALWEEIRSRYILLQQWRCFPGIMEGWCNAWQGISIASWHFYVWFYINQTHYMLHLFHFLLQSSPKLTFYVGVAIISNKYTLTFPFDESDYLTFIFYRLLFRLEGNLILSIYKLLW